MLLSMIQYTELLWEMVAKRKGEKSRWRIVVILEVIKAICRFLLLRITNSRPLVTPALPEREVIPEDAEKEESEEEFEDEGFHEGSEKSVGSGSGGSAGKGGGSVWAAVEVSSNIRAYR